MNDDHIKLLHHGLQLLAGVCDGASTRDDNGFSKYDSEIGHSLARSDAARWTPKQQLAAWALCNRYRGQLSGLGIDATAIPKPENGDGQPKELKPIEQVLAGGSWSDPRRVETRKGPRMVRTASPTPDFWDAWKAQGGELKAKGYSVSKYEGEWQVTHWMPVENGPQTAVNGPTTALNAGAGDIPPEPDITIPTAIEEKLLPFQPDSVKRLVAALQKHGGAVDGSELGVGKTYCSLAVCKILGLSPAVVCPKAVIPSWQRAAKYMEVPLQFITNYEMVRRGTTPHGKWVKKTTPRGKEYEAFEWNVQSNTLLITDELQKMKSHDSLNAKLGLGALDQGLKILGLSGTIASNPMEMKFVGRLCKLHNGKGFWSWMLRNGVIQGRFGLEFKGNAQTMQRLHSQIFPEHGSRIRISEIPGYPECQTEAQAFDCNGNGEKIQAVYDEMFEELAKVQAREDLSPGAKHGHKLALMMYARQRTEMLKIPAVCEMVEDYLENGRSVVIFTNFKETIQALSERLKTKCVVEGGQKDEVRQANIDAFQADKERVILVNIQSGGVGVSLHATLPTSHPRVGILFPTWSGQDLKQATGRIHRAGATSKAYQIVFYADGTCENRICEVVRAKLARMAALVDGDLTPPGLF